MNFDCFEHLKGENEYLEACINDCCAAERCVRVTPGDTAIYARRAIENLFKDQSKRHNTRPANLAESIQLNCDALTTDSELVRQKADEIRKVGNRAVHPTSGKQKGGQDVFADIDAETKKNIAQAMSIVKDLFDLLCLLHGNPAGHEFDEMLVPFGQYFIERRISSPGAGLEDDYFVYRESGYRVHYYLQYLSWGEAIEFQQRQMEANRRVYENYTHGSRLCLPDLVLSLTCNSDCKLLLYSARAQSKLLSELDKPMTMRQAMKLGMDSCDALLELKKLGMHHRNIFPASILLNKTGDDHYEALLLNLQTSKILDSTRTVNTRLAAACDSNLYIPNFLRLQNINGSEWEKVDVHALARVVLFCLNRKLAYATSVGSFSMYTNVKFSPRLRELYTKLFYRDPGMQHVPSVQELREVFAYEYDHCNESPNR